MREVPGFPAVRIGRHVYVDLDQWAQFKKNGGRVLAGGWRKQAPTSGPVAQTELQAAV
jgi:hypothetical protein